MCSYQDEIKYWEHVCCASQDKVQPVEKGAEDIPTGTRKPHITAPSQPRLTKFQIWFVEIQQKKKNTEKKLSYVFNIP